MNIKQLVDAVGERAKNCGFNVMRWCVHAQSKMKAIVPPKNPIVWTQNILSVFALKVAFSNLFGTVHACGRVLS